MDLGINGRVYVVTGGSKGLGFATADALVQEGARVILVARDRVALDSAVARLGSAAFGFPGDLADEPVAAAAVAAAVEQFGRVDGGLISVGGPPAGTPMTTSDEQWRAAFESVFLGGVRMARALCAGIEAAGDPPTGAIALVLSTSAVEVFTGLTTSNGLRPGLAMLVTDLADEVGPIGIRVNGLLPGRIATERLGALDEATGDAEAARERASQRIPLRRYGEPAEFGRTAAFLLSPAASYVSGSLVRVDGGATRHP